MTVTTLAGSGTSGNVNGTGAAARFASLNGVAVDTAGNLYVSDSTNGNIRKITPAGVVTTLASVPTAFGVAVDAAGAVYTTGYNSNEIKKITSGVVTTLASGGDLNAPVGLAVDAAGNLYVAGHVTSKVHKITPAGVVSTFAGSGTRGYLDGTGTAAQLDTPRGVATDSAGNVYVADPGNHRIRKISPAGVVTTLAGSGTGGFADGTGTSAKFNDNYGVAVDSAGNIYVADTDNHRIRKITSAGVVTTLAGTGTQGFLNSTAAASQFSSPNAVAVDAAGNLYVTEGGYYAVRKISRSGAGVSVSNVDGGTLTAALSVTNGTLTATLTGGATVSAGALGSASVTLSGTPTQLNAALLTLTYQGTTNFSGADTLTVTVSDGTTPVTATSAITVVALSEAPSFTTLATRIPAGTTFTSRGYTSTGWGSVASSSDGTKLVAVGVSWGTLPLMTSTDSGATWTVRDSSRSGGSVASSADGTKLAATTRNGLIYTSVDSGVTWVARSGSGSRAWLDLGMGIASSADGTKLVATVTNGLIYTSTDSGVTWVGQTGSGSRNWSGVTSSADGSKLAAAVTNGQLYTSMDSGVTWTARESSRNWLGIGSSADGTKLAAGTGDTGIYISSDSGVTWALSVGVSGAIGQMIAVSADGTTIVGVAKNAPLRMSRDFGATWTNTAGGSWFAVALSSDGSKIALATEIGGLITTADSTVSQVTVARGSGAYSQSNFATNLSAGAADETAETWTFALTNTNNGIFTVQPAISPTGTLTFTPSGSSGSTGTATVSITMTDSVGLSSAVQTLAITVASTNTAPTLSAIALSGTENTTLTFTAANFTGAYADTEGAPLASITVVSLPATGVLKLSGVNVTASQVITATDLPNLTYVPATNANGAKTFTVQASDGSVLSTSATTVTMTLAAVTDAPSLAAIAVNGTED
ncbi:MAG: Ig-like domain-containing protein, partial [Verrucomicrobia bacterium]|nr:Ig-like domain-containing protein [Verrucomicrobiota bacterium]